MNDEFTGDGIGAAETASSLVTWVRNTHVSDARCMAYDVPGERSAADRSVRQLLPSAERPSDPRKRDWERANRYAILQHCSQAKELVSRLLDACGRQDFMEQAILGKELSDELQALWDFRSMREEEWSEILNFLQAALAQEEFELFQRSQWQAVQQVVVDYLAGGAVDPEDVIRTRQVLRDAGLDPWKAISSLDE